MRHWLYWLYWFFFRHLGAWHGPPAGAEAAAGSNPNGVVQQSPDF